MKLKLILTLSLVATMARAADAPFSSFTDLGNNLASGDLFAVTDISDPTQSANGTTKKISATNVGAFYLNDTAFAASWDADTTHAPTKNSVYDWGVTFDTDGDGKVNLLDGISAAGFPYTNAAGAVQGTRSLAEGVAIDITNTDGSGGNPTIGLDGTEVQSANWGDGVNASNIWTFQVTGTDPVMTFSSGAVNISTGTLQQGGVDVLTTTGSQVVTIKTIDGASNVLKFKSFPQFTSPLFGVGATVGSTFTTLGYGLATFLNGTDEASNYVEWRILVPADWDTAVDPRVKIVDMLGGADLSARQYSMQVASVGSSEAATGTVGTKVDINFSGDGTGASGDAEISATTTLTGWGAAVTPGELMVIRLARDGDEVTTDASTTASTVIAIELEYGVSQ